MKTCVIYDEEASYGRRLFSGLLKKAQSQFNVMLFTGAEELKKYLKETVPDVVLICENSMNDWLSGAYKGKIIVLTEEAMINEDCEFNGQICHSIYRYQSLDKIYSEIIIKGDLKRSTHFKTMEIIGIYSPVNVISRQSFALCMAKIMSEKFKVLYINLEEFSGLSGILRSDNQYTLSDAVYFYRQSGVCARDKIEQTIKSVSGIDYIPPVVCSEDISNVGADEMADFIEKLGEMFGYEAVIVDISSALHQPWRLLESCRIVYTPIKKDYISVNRMADFENYYANTGMGHVLDRISKIELPESGEDIAEGFWERITYSGMYRYVRSMLECDDSGDMI